MENKINRINGIIDNMAVDAEELKLHIGKTVRIHGSIYKIRKMSDFAFVLLRTKRTVVQCVYAKEFSNFGKEAYLAQSPQFYK